MCLEVFFQNFVTYYPINPFRLWLPSQKGLLAEPPHLHKETPLGFSIVDPSARVKTQGPENLIGPFVTTVAFNVPPVPDSTVSNGGGGFRLMAIAPEGQACTVSMISEVVDLSICIQGLSRGLKTSGKLRKQIPE